jgi:hypothetical protein
MRPDAFIRVILGVLSPILAQRAVRTGSKCCRLIVANCGVGFAAAAKPCRQLASRNLDAR